MVNHIRLRLLNTGKRISGHSADDAILSTHEEDQPPAPGGGGCLVRCRLRLAFAHAPSPPRRFFPRRRHRRNAPGDPATATPGATNANAAAPAGTARSRCHAHHRLDQHRSGDPLLNDPTIEEDMARPNLRESTVDGLRSQLDLERNDAPGVRIGTFTLKPTLGQTFNYRKHKDRQFQGKPQLSRNRPERHADLRLVAPPADGDRRRHLAAQRLRHRRDRTDRRRRCRTPARYRQRHDRERCGPAIISSVRIRPIRTRSATPAPSPASINIRSAPASSTISASCAAPPRSISTAMSMAMPNSSDGTTLSRRIGTAMRARSPCGSATNCRRRSSRSSKRRPENRSTICATDTLGFERSYDSYGGRAGVEVDLGEKLNGEIALGYETYRFDDDRLDDLSGLTIDGLLNWSPQRGTERHLWHFDRHRTLDHPRRKRRAGLYAEQQGDARAALGAGGAAVEQPDLPQLSVRAASRTTRRSGLPAPASPGT